MARENWAIAYVRFTCDKCGDAQQDQQGGPNNINWDGWRNLTITKPMSHDDPLGKEGHFDLCPGCAGMLQHFLGLGTPQ